MNTIETILDEIRASHKLPILRIVETGCQDTIDIAAWCSKHRDSIFDTADLDGVQQEKLHSELEKSDTAKYCTFHTQDHKKYLGDLSWSDVAFLYPEDLVSGLEEFNLAASAGAVLIVIRDYQTRASLAIKQAKRFQWKVLYKEPYCILIQPGA